MFVGTLSSIVGAVILISIILPWFLIAFAIVSVLYALAAAFYRASARETKVRTSQAQCIRDFDKDTTSGSTLSYDRRYIPIFLRP